jgi:hypothetical protein
MGFIGAGLVNDKAINSIKRLNDAHIAASLFPLRVPVNVKLPCCGNRGNGFFIYSAAFSALW